MMIIDTHVHYNLEPLSNDAKKHLQASRDAGVVKEIIIGTSIETSTKAYLQAKQFSAFWSAGTHPTEYQERIEQAVTHKVSSFEGALEEAIEELSHLRILAKQERCISIGEIGLDYYHLPESGIVREESKKLQKQLFIEQVRIAIEFELPIIFHVRDKKTPEEHTEGNAYWDALGIIQQLKPQKFTLHCVSGPLSYVKAAIELGGYMGFDGNISYPNAQSIRDIFKIVPQDKRLVETDAPFLPPQEFRGKICEPWMISKTVEYIEKELKVDRKSFTENAERLFKLDSAD